MLRAIIGNAKEYKKNAFIASLLITTLLTVIINLILSDHLKANPDLIKYYSMVVILVNTYISSLINELYEYQFNRLKKIKRESIINNYDPNDLPPEIKDLKEEHEKEPLEEYKKQY